MSDVTEGGLVRPMLGLAWPMVVFQLLQVTYNVADTLWLGRLSADAVGAMSLAFPLVFFLISVGGGFTAAGSILVAQNTGAGDARETGKVAGQTVGFVLILAAVLGVAGHFLTRDMLAFLPATAETAARVVPLAAAYMEVFYLGLPALFGFFLFTALLRGYGDTRTPMRVMFVSVALNVVLDPLLIFGWGPFPALGIAGAAYATVAARMLATVIGAYLLFVVGVGPDIRLPDLRPELGYVRKIVRVGVPSAAEQSMSSVAMISLVGIVSTFNPAVVAAYGLGNRLISLIFLPAMGLGQATNTIVGQNLGAGKPERAERATWLAAKVVAGVLLVAAVVAYAFAESIVGVFIATGTDQAAATVAHGADFLRIAAGMFAFTGVLQVVLGAFRGAGNTGTALAFSVVTLWAVRVPVTAYLVFVAGWGPTGIWAGVALGDVLGALTATLWFTRGTWKSTIVDTAGAGPADD